MEDVINKVLEGIRDIVEIEWYHSDLVESESDDEDCFLFISFDYLDSVENNDDVQFDEDLDFIQNI